MSNDDIQGGYRGFGESERLRRVESRERWKIYNGDPNGNVTAGMSVYCWDRANNDLYVNDDNATGWTFIGGDSGVVGSGTATRIAFWSAATTLSSDADLYWDNVNKRLGIGTTTPDRELHSEVVDAVTNAVSYAGRLSHTLTAPNVAVAFFGTGLEWELQDAGGTNRIAATEEVSWASAAAISYSAYRAFYVSASTSLQLFLLMDGSPAQMKSVFNPFAADIDFNVQGDTDSNAIYMQASSNYTGFGTNTPATKIETQEDKTLGASPADDYSAALTLDPAYTGNFTVTRHNYIDLNDIALNGGAAVTNAAVMRFDNNFGTHKALTSSFNTTDSNGDTTAWAGGVIINVNGTLYKLPAIAV